MLSALLAARLVVVDQVGDHAFSVEFAPHRVAVLSVDCLERRPAEGERLVWRPPRRLSRRCPWRLSPLPLDERTAHTESDR